MGNVKQLKTTVAPVEPGNTSTAAPEFGRIPALWPMFGIRRGTAYNLLADGKIKGVLLRVRGQKSGVRLIDLDSVREYLHRQMAEQEATIAKEE